MNANPARGPIAGLWRLTATALLAACTTRPPAPEPLSPQQVAQIVASPDRSAADRITDKGCKPEPMLLFIGVRQGMVALEVGAGDGYASELLARAIGPGGEVYGQNPRNEFFFDGASIDGGPIPIPWSPAAPERAGRPASDRVFCTIPRQPLPSLSLANALTQRDVRLRAAGIAAAPMFSFVQGFDNPVPPKLADGGFDLVASMFVYHHLRVGVDRDGMNRALLQALKPGGTYVIADRSLRHDKGDLEFGTQAFVRREVEAAGFHLVAERNLLPRSPADPREGNTPDPTMPMDEFVLKFVKP